MKKIALILACALAFTGCRSETEYGDCIGIAEERNPNLKYEASTKNIVLAVIFFELIFPPLIVLLSETSCPVGNK